MISLYQRRPSRSNDSVDRHVCPAERFVEASGQPQFPNSRNRFYGHVFVLCPSSGLPCRRFLLGRTTVEAVARAGCLQMYRSGSGSSASRQFCKGEGVLGSGRSLVRLSTGEGARSRSTRRMCRATNWMQRLPGHSSSENLKVTPKGDTISPSLLPLTTVSLLTSLCLGHHLLCLFTSLGGSYGKLCRPDAKAA
jgi:hypothetical protein